MKSGALPRFSSAFSAATAAVVAPAAIVAATAAVVAPSVSAAAENNDDEQNDPAAVTAPTVVPTTHRNFTSSIIWQLRTFPCRHPNYPMRPLPGWFRSRGISPKNLLNATGVIVKCRKNLKLAGRPAALPAPPLPPAAPNPAADAAGST